MKTLPDMVARTRGEVMKFYEQLVRKESVVELFANLQAARLGTPHIEAFLRKFLTKKGRNLDTELSKGLRIGRDKLLKLTMELEARSAKKEEVKARSRFWKARRNLEELVQDKKKYKKLISKIKKEGLDLLRELRTKNDTKVQHYKTMYKVQHCRDTPEQAARPKP